MLEGGLPLSSGGTVGNAYFINEMAVGFASSERLGGDYILGKHQDIFHLINMWLEAGAVVVDPKGLVQVQFLLDPPAP